jgi:Spy/CpxP family protein refolding chaperone
MSASSRRSDAAAIVQLKEHTVRHIATLVVAASLFAAGAGVWATAQQARPASTASTGIDEVLQAVRLDLQSDRADTLAKNLTLTAEQAAKFWPVYQAYQNEQDAIMDDQLKGIQRYIEGFDALDDAGALALITGHLDRDTRMVELRRKWLGDFQRVLGTKLAVRAMQIDRRLSLVHQLQFAAKIPLVR